MGSMYSKGFFLEHIRFFCSSLKKGWFSASENGGREGEEEEALLLLGFLESPSAG